MASIDVNAAGDGAGVKMAGRWLALELRQLGMVHVGDETETAER